MNNKLVPGSVLGGALLISGSCIGAGMLGLPVLLGLCGFLPSLFLLFGSFVFMTFTGLLVVEVNGWFKKRVNFITMVETSFGNGGRVLTWILYLCLFYSLLVAYFAGGGKILANFLPFNIGADTASIFMVIVLSIVVYFGTKPVDLLNRIFVFGLIISYLGMIFLGLSKIKGSLFLHVNMKYFLVPIPVLITSFGFHNMIPSLTAYMKGDLKRTKYAILIGCLVSLIIYFFWILFIVGFVPVDGKYGLLNSYLEGNEATIALKHILNSKIVVNFASFFALFAIITSILAQSLGLSHFLADGVKVKPTRKNSVYFVMFSTLPPLIFSLVYPKIFFTALGFAGAYFAVILFGIFPALMVWMGRYYKKETSPYRVKGGKISLMLVLLFSFVIIFSQMYSSFVK